MEVATAGKRVGDGLGGWWAVVRGLSGQLFGPGWAEVPVRLEKSRKREDGGVRENSVKLFSIHRRRVGIDS